MVTCSFIGNSGMYGLGIRIGFYLHYYGIPIASVIAPSEAGALRLSQVILVLAIFLGLVISTLSDMHTLQVVDVYISLLLAFGSYFSLVPLYLWRLLTCFQPQWDPARYPLVELGEWYGQVTMLLVLAMSSFQLWFWFDRVPDLNGFACRQFGFFFGQVRLNAKWFVAIHIVIHFFLIAICAFAIGKAITKNLGLFRLARRPKISKFRAQNLRKLDIFTQIATVSVAIVAIELTIQWNYIEGVNSLASAAQMIPFVIGIAVCIMVLFRWAFVWKDSEYGSERDLPVRQRQRNAWPGQQYQQRPRRR